MEPRASVIATPTETVRLAAKRGTAAARTGADVPVLEARPGGPAERFAERLGDRHPVIVFLSAIIAGYVLLAASTIGLGFLVTKVILSIGGVARADERVEVWLASHRSHALTDASLVGSIGAGGVVLPIVVGLGVVTFVLLRRWRIAAFLLFAIGVESGAYRATTIFVERHRPRVPRLESLAVNASFPSGHTAASIAVYAGLVLLLTSRFRNPTLRTVSWAIAVAIPLFVAWARMYRGMHHPLDSVAGGLLGVAALLVVVFAVRAAGVAADRRQAQTDTQRT
jgi:membrane-associated phospholipid phosphatase